jgi:hypothetical protein
MRADPSPCFQGNNAASFTGVCAGKLLLAKGALELVCAAGTVCNAVVASGVCGGATEVEALTAGVSSDNGGISDASRGCASGHSAAAAGGWASGLFCRRFCRAKYTTAERATKKHTTSNLV